MEAGGIFAEVGYLAAITHEPTRHDAQLPQYGSASLRIFRQVPVDLHHLLSIHRE